MQLILDSDEAWSIMTLVISQVLDGVELSDKGRNAVRRWRTEHADGSEAMHQLTETMNEAIGTVIDERTRRVLKRKGRYISSADRR